MDGSGVGRGCCALMMHVISQGRALPLAWRVRQCPKGHVPEDLHIALVELVLELVTVQVVKTGITPQLATSDRFWEAETEPLHPTGRLHMRR
jgi:hypothetical protein